jgi:simple sugar transport system ATP-binding protein
MSSVEDVLIMSNISKSFPGVLALDNVDFSLRTGEVHALLGENGAGKSTLIKVLTGVEKLDSGTITLSGRQVFVTSPHHAQTLGISTVYQEINLCPNLSVAENILIGREPHRAGSIDWSSLNARASEILQHLDVDIDVRQSLDMYPVAIQQMVAIARALEVSARVLILDEPTSSLSAHETENLFDVMRRLQDEGMSIIFITHFLDQVYEVSNRITVLRNGKLVGTYDTDKLPRVELVARMIGRELVELDAMGELKEAQAGSSQHEVVLEARELGLSGAISPFDLDLHDGEVVGFAGLLGSGRTETADLLFGIDRPDSGTLKIAGKAVDHNSPLRSIHNGMAYCPEDRKADGIVGELTVRENIALALQASRGWMRYIEPATQREIADRYIKLLGISTRTADQLVKNLSGGNQQKVILARWLATEPEILILDEPTRGIDVGAKAEIQKLVLTLASEGKTCIFISSEMDEVVRTSHRILVLRDGEIVAELTGDEMNEQTIMHTIAGEE